MIETQEECIALLQKILWDGQPTCPYCNSTKASALKNELRYHCNQCFTSYSVTVGTLFHRTHVPLPKWFISIFLEMTQSPNISTRALAARIGVNKNTAASMLRKIRKAVKEEPLFMQKLLEAIINAKK